LSAFAILVPQDPSPYRRSASMCASRDRSRCCRRRTRGNPPAPVYPAGRQRGQVRGRRRLQPLHGPPCSARMIDQAALAAAGPDPFSGGAELRARDGSPCPDDADPARRGSLKARAPCSRRRGRSARMPPSTVPASSSSMFGSSEPGRPRPAAAGAAPLGSQVVRTEADVALHHVGRARLRHFPQPSASARCTASRM